MSFSTRPLLLILGMGLLSTWAGASDSTLADLAQLEAELTSALADVEETAAGLRVASALRGGVRKAPRGSHHPSPDEAVAAPPQFPGSRIVTNVTGLVDPKLGKHPPPGSGQTKSLNGWANKPEAQVWALCYSSFTDNRDNATAFHKQCDMHDETMVFVKNELNFTFGGYVRCIVLLMPAS